MLGASRRRVRGAITAGNDEMEMASVGFPIANFGSTINYTLSDNSGSTTYSGSSLVPD